MMDQPAPFRLQGYIAHDVLRVVVETPAGSSMKLGFDPEAGGFTAVRELPLGLVYPFDFGFVPGTAAEDGDPVDAIILHAKAGFPGVIVPCRLLGMIVFRQREGEHPQKPITNNRLVAVPAFHDSFGSALADSVPERVRHELESFFRSSVLFTDKEPVVSRWADAHSAHTYLARVLTMGQRPGPPAPST